jgi:hypothetical protein
VLHALPISFLKKEWRYVSTPLLGFYSLF